MQKIHKFFLIPAAFCFLLYVFVLSRVDIATDAPPLARQVRVLVDNAAALEGGRKDYPVFRKVTYSAAAAAAAALEGGQVECTSGGSERTRGATDARITSIPLLNRLLLRKELRTMAIVGRSGGLHFGFLAVSGGTATVYSYSTSSPTASPVAIGGGGGGSNDLLHLLVPPHSLSSFHRSNNYLTAALAAGAGAADRWIVNQLPSSSQRHPTHIDVLLIQEWDGYEHIISYFLNNCTVGHVVVLNSNHGQCPPFHQFVANISACSHIYEFKNPDTLRAEYAQCSVL